MLGFNSAYSETKANTIEKGVGNLSGFLALLYLFLLAVWPLDILLFVAVLGYAVGKGGRNGIIETFGVILGRAFGYLVGVATKKPVKEQPHS